MKKPAKTILMVLLAVIMMVLPACQSNETPGTPDTSGPKTGGILKAGLHASALGLDPHLRPNQPAYWVFQLMYNYLVTMDKDLKIIGDLATSWEMPDDHTYVFTLREGVKFHNGRELVASDVKYSLERIRDLKTESLRSKNFQDIESIETPDDYTVKIVLSKPNGAFLVHLAHPAAAIVPKEVVEEHGNLNNVAVGTGPFMLESYTPESITLKRNPDYFEEGLPYLDGIEFRGIENDNARTAALRAGDVDWITFVPSNLIGSLKEDPNLVVATGISGQFYHLMMNTQREPFDNVKVRQAIMWALDRDEIVDAALFGEGEALDAGAIPKWDKYGLKEPIYHQDLEKAKALLEEAGLPDGFKTNIAVWAPQSHAVNAALTIQKQLGALGIEVEIEQYGEWGIYQSEALHKANCDMTIQGFGGNVDPDEWLYERFITGGGSNFMKFSDAEVDELLNQGRATIDEEERLEIYSRAQKRIAEIGSSAFLFNQYQPEAWRTTVQGFEHLSTLNLISLKQTWLES